MEIVKDLTPDLHKLEDKDRFYQVKATLIHLLAPQNPETVRKYTYTKTGWGKIIRTEATTDGSPQDQTAPRRKTRTRKGEGEIKEGQCWSFELDNADPDKAKGFYIPWGGSWGIFKNAWRRTLMAKADKYTNPKLDLIEIYPSKLYVKGDVNSLNGEQPKVVLTKRNVRGGDSVMVEEFFDFVGNKQIEFFVEVDSGNPINEEKLVEMLKSLNTLANFGPSKRGKIRIDSISSIRLTEDEVKNLSNN